MHAALTLSLRIELLLKSSYIQERFASMTRPKKWFLDKTESSSEDRGIVIKNSEGLLKKPNVTQPLGCLGSCSTSDTSPNGILVSSPPFVKISRSICYCLSCILFCSSSVRKVE